MGGGICVEGVIGAGGDDIVGTIDQERLETFAETGKLGAAK